MPEEEYDYYFDMGWHAYKADKYTAPPDLRALQYRAWSEGYYYAGET